MLLVYTLTELEKLLAEESKMRVGYDKDGAAVIKATAGSVPVDGVKAPCVIIEVALPEKVADEVMPSESQVKEKKAAGTVRGKRKA